MVSISIIETPPFLLPGRYNNSLSMLSVLYKNMFLLLSCYNNSWSMVSISTIENHGVPVAMPFLQHMEHGPCL